MDLVGNPTINKLKAVVGATVLEQTPTPAEITPPPPDEPNARQKWINAAAERAADPKTRFNV
jgi:hypothetical protein